VERSSSDDEEESEDDEEQGQERMGFDRLRSVSLAFVIVSVLVWPIRGFKVVSHWIFHRRV
jgi:hypothetical protein